MCVYHVVNIHALGSDKLLENICFILQVVEMFPSKKLVHLLKEVVFDW